VTAKEVPERPDEFNMFSQGPPRLGDTYSIDDTEWLFENLCDVALWGQTEYRSCLRNKFCHDIVNNYITIASFI